MENKLLEKLKKLNEHLENLVQNDDLEQLIENAINEPVEISLKKGVSDIGTLSIDGDGLALLVALVGIKKRILYETECDEETFAELENYVGVREVDHA